MRLSTLRSLLAIFMALSVSACTTSTTSESSAAPLAAPSANVASAPPPGVEPISPPTPVSPQDLQKAATPAKAVDVPVEVATPQVPKTNPIRKMGLECTQGTKVTGLVDRWSPLSTCPAGYVVTGLSRIDLQGDHNRPNLHVNDFICDDRGCKAWCIGDGCTVEARCCRIIDQGPP